MHECTVDVDDGVSKLIEVGQRRPPVLDAQHLEFPDGAFGTVVFSLCLCTIPAPRSTSPERPGSGSTPRNVARSASSRSRSGV
jgi:hypothetical protein